LLRGGGRGGLTELFCSYSRGELSAHEPTKATLSEGDILLGWGTLHLQDGYNRKNELIQTNEPYFRTRAPTSTLRQRFSSILEGGEYTTPEGKRVLLKRKVYPLGECRRERGILKYFYS